MVGESEEGISSEEDVIEAWKEFAEQSLICRLTSNEEEIAMLSKGVIENLKNKGLKYCPCRIPSGNYQDDLNLICPCNFLRQKNWAELGECWCGLFVKRE
jgi:ferredoxin-thioredoxin reductase catalytic chain